MSRVELGCLKSQLPRAAHPNLRLCRPPNVRSSRVMASNSSSCNEKRGPSSATPSTSFSPDVTNGIYQEQSPSTFANENAQVTIPEVGRETCNATYLSTYEVGQSSSGMNPLYPNRSYYATPVGQASPTSPFSASAGSTNVTINQVWDGSFDPNAGPVLHCYGTSNDAFDPNAGRVLQTYGTSNDAFDPNAGRVLQTYGTSNDAFGPNAYSASPSYAASTYESGIPNGYTNAYQPLIPSTQSAAPLIPYQTSTLMPSSKRHPCRVGCKISFKRRTDMERHAKSHEAPSLSCDRCSRGFYRSDKLKEHMKVHKD